MKNIIKRYQNNVKTIIKNITASYNEDIEQEVYVKTWKNLNKYNEKGKFKQWISIITSNLCKDYLRKSNKEKNDIALTDEITNIIPAKDKVEDSFETKLRNKKVAEAIISLPQKMQEVIVLYEIKGLDYQEISERIKCPLGTVKSRIFKARQELSIKLKDLL